MSAQPNNVFTKTMTIYDNDGKGQGTSFTGTAALAMQKKLEDNPNFVKTVESGTGIITFRNLNPNKCGICKTAIVVPNGKHEGADKCEEALGCPKE